MNKLWHKVLISAMALGAVATGANDADAWLKFKNSTNTTINTAHAFDSVSSLFCGYFDACVTAGVDNYRVRYWWVLAPGAESTVSAEDFNNALNEYYAFGVDGSVWSGGGHTFRVKTNAGGEQCGDDGAVGALVTFRKINSHRCCGASCIGFSYASDYRLQFIK